jgi:NSS family neurotransmitter:Na+ symporter
MYLVGRYLPLVMLLWILVTYALSQVGITPV